MVEAIKTVFLVPKLLEITPTLSLHFKIKLKS